MNQLVHDSPSMGELIYNAKMGIGFASHPIPTDWGLIATIVGTISLMIVLVIIAYRVGYAMGERGVVIVQCPWWLEWLLFRKPKADKEVPTT